MNMRTFLRSIILISVSFLLNNTRLQAQANFQWTKTMGDTLLDYAKGIAVDDSGNVYTVGTFSGVVDFNPGAGVNNLSSPNSPSVFISKLDANGNFKWARKIGGTLSVYGNDIALNSLGELYIVGSFSGTTDFNPSVIFINNVTSSGNRDAYVLKLSSAGAFIWVKTFGDNGKDEANRLALSSNGDVHVTGRFELTVDFNPNVGTANLTAVNEDAYILKLDASGNYIWSKKLGGTGDEEGLDMAIDDIGNVYSIGSFDADIDLDPSIINSTSITTNGLRDIYISKLSASGNFIWGKRIGNANNDFASGIALDTTSNPYISGYFEDTLDFNPGAGTTNLIANFTDAYVLKLTAISGNFTWVKQIGGGNFDRAYGITIDKNNAVYTIGQFKSTVDFDPGPGTFNLSGTGNGRDLFVLKLSDAGNFIWAKATGGSGDVYASSIAVSAMNDVLVTGYFEDTVDFNDPNAVNLSSNGMRDIFIYKLSQNNPSDLNDKSPINTLFSVFPNPAQTSVNIIFTDEIESVQVQIIDVFGKIVCLNDNTGRDLSIDVSALHKGLYYLQVKVDRGIIGTQKIIIE
jgi:hypothetical protein